MATSRAGQVMILISLVVVLVLVAWYGSRAWEDSGPFAIALFGVPALCAAGALWAARASRSAPAVVGTLGLLSLAWSLVTGLGLGMVFLPSSLLLLAAAAVSWGDRARDAARPVGS